ncbi:MAG: LptA/OstA family protein [Alphaproteobacteria bacterium]|jgi:lipopolysaccharide export system protein LptA
MMRLTLCFALAGAIWIQGLSDSTAQSLGFSKQGDGPIQIEADEGIEWQRAKQVYLARGNARATQGGVSVEGDELIAHYKPNAAGENEIYRINANGNVRITSESEVAVSDNAVYDIDNGVLVMTGDTIRLDTAEDTIIARESLEYYEQQQMAIARGDALAIRDDRRLRADTLTAHFGEGGRSASMDRIEANGNVLVSTPTDIVRAEQGDYNPDRGLATLTGNVKITRGDTQLNGDRAEVNLTTGESRLLSSRSGERVRGLFLPKSSSGNGAGQPSNTGPTGNQ